MARYDDATVMFREGTGVTPGPGGTPAEGADVGGPAAEFPEDPDETTTTPDAEHRSGSTAAGEHA